MAGTSSLAPGQAGHRRSGAAAHLLIDFGEVLTFRQPSHEVRRMAALAEMDLDAFIARYWHYRPSYDAGAAADEYWAAVLGRMPQPDELAALIRCDIESWLHLDPVMLDKVRSVHARGVPVSLLSNAPGGLAERLKGYEPFAFFENLLFSADLGLVKPDPAIFEASLSVLQSEAHAVLFVDDRSENIAAAARLGFAVLHFERCLDGMREFDEALNGWADRFKR